MRSYSATTAGSLFMLGFPSRRDLPPQPRGSDNHMFKVLALPNPLTDVGHRRADLAHPNVMTMGDQATQQPALHILVGIALRDLSADRRKVKSDERQAVWQPNESLACVGAPHLLRDPFSSRRRQSSFCCLVVGDWFEDMRGLASPDWQRNQPLSPGGGC